MSSKHYVIAVSMNKVTVSRAASNFLCDLFFNCLDVFRWCCCCCRRRHISMMRNSVHATGMRTKVAEWRRKSEKKQNENSNNEHGCEQERIDGEREREIETEQMYRTHLNGLIKICIQILLVSRELASPNGYFIHCLVMPLVLVVHALSVRVRTVIRDCLPLNLLAHASDHRPFIAYQKSIMAGCSGCASSVFTHKHTHLIDPSCHF